MSPYDAAASFNRRLINCRVWCGVSYVLLQATPGVSTCRRADMFVNVHHTGLMHQVMYRSETELLLHGMRKTKAACVVRHSHGIVHCTPDQC